MSGFILNKNEKYLEALKQIKDWTTVSDWAKKVAELYPEILKEANKQSKSYKRPSTGVREIAARIGAKFSTTTYDGLVEIDDSQRPRRVRFIKSQISQHNQKLSEKEEYNRSKKIRYDNKNLSSHENYRKKEFEKITKTLSKELHINFELEHAAPLKGGGKDNPNNMQILIKAHNGKKSTSKWTRFTLEEQIDYIRALIDIQKNLEKKMGVKLNDKIIEMVIANLRNIFNKK